LRWRSITAEREAAQRDVKLEPVPETTGAAAPRAPDVKPDAKKTKAQGTARSQNRTRPARPRQPAEPATFAEQPFFSGHRRMY
jgi:hypothetical protein